jgi:hypothetical protein
VTNPAPTATDNNSSTNQDTPVTITVLADDTDPDGDALTVTGATDPANGSVVVNADGTITYTPDAGFNGTDTFTYTISDGNGGTSQATVTVTVIQDTDGDGIPDSIDIDDDNDGIPDVVEENGNPNRDTDGDGIPDSKDLDSDNDGILDIEEAGGTDTNHDGRVDDATDTDNDGLADVVDANPTTPDNPTTLTEGRGVTSLPVTDTDGDGTPDFQDVDSDNDGISDLVEGGTDPANDTNNDGMIDSAVNPNGIPAVVDPATGGTPAATPDTDGDGVDDYRDLDSDNDGLNDVVEAGGTDSDGNGQIDTPDTLTDPTTIPDQDGDGIPDPLEPNNPNLSPVIDTDGDGVVDNITDGDGDGIPDMVDGMPSTFGDSPMVRIDSIFWEDTNGNGQMDAGENPIAGAKVELLDAAGNPVLCPHAISGMQTHNISAAEHCTAVTDENGRYSFPTVPPATYQVRFTLPEDKVDEGFSIVGADGQSGNTITVKVNASEGSSVVLAAATAACACSDIESDSGDALGTLSLLLMALLTLSSGLLFVRREEV